MKKKYESSQAENNKVEEPAESYYTSSLSNPPFSSIAQENKRSMAERKADFVHSVLNDMDDETFERLETVFYALKNINQTPPCQYSVDELRERVLTATRHIEEGKFYTDDELDDFVLG